MALIKVYGKVEMLHTTNEEAVENSLMLTGSVPYDHHGNDAPGCVCHCATATRMPREGLEPPCRKTVLSASD